MRLPALAASFLAAGTALAEPPRVVTDIAPVHGLVAAVMDGIGTPHLLLPPGASPHGYALKPSDAAALERAGIVFWVGEELTPWLARPLETLGERGDTVALLDAAGTTRFAYRELGDHEDHAENGHDDNDHHDHEEHAEDGHDDHDHEDHAEDSHDGHDDHDHEGTDPHAWLSPDNAQVWLDVIAGKLAEADPDNAAAYRANAAAAAKSVAEATAEIAARLAAHEGKRYVVQHNAYQYFERRFGFEPVANIAEGDAAAPGPRRIAELRALIAEKGAICVFTEPQLQQGIARIVAEGSSVRIATIDPLGSAIAPGPAFYPALLRALGASMEDCFGAN